MVQKLYTYFRGDEAEKTGEVTVNLYGGLFYEVRLIEGHLAGETRFVNAEKVSWHLKSTDPIGYHARVLELEQEGLCTSDAQAVADVEFARKVVQS